MLFSFCHRFMCTVDFPLFFLILFVSLIWHAPDSAAQPAHTMCGNNFSIIVKFCFIFPPALSLWFFFFFHVAFVAVYLASGQNAIYVLRASFILFSFDFCLFVFVFLLSKFSYFLRFLFCFWMLVRGYWQLSFVCDLRLSVRVKRVIFLLQLGKWRPNLRRELFIHMEGYVDDFVGV